MNKLLRINLMMFVLSCLTLLKANAQTVAVTPSAAYVCLGDELVLDANISGLPGGVTATAMKFDMDNNGTFEGTVPGAGPNYQFRYTYATAGNKTIKVEADLSNGSKASITLNTIVYNLPIAAATVNGSPIQCFRGNLVTLVDNSQKTDNNIAQLQLLWGDGFLTVQPTPANGQQYAHTYSASNQYNITVKVTDDKGCFKEVTYNGLITIKNNITPSFQVFGSRNCDTSQYMFKNTTISQVPFNQVSRYTWDFGDGNTVTRSAPFVLPRDEYNYDTIYHKYTKNGTFLPALIIEDVTGCIDSFRMSSTSPGNKPQNIKIQFDTISMLTLNDPVLRRDSVCWGREGNATLIFKQTPNDLVNPGNGELLWVFDDPQSMQLNFNTSNWTVPHTFVTRLGGYRVRLTLSPAPCNKTLFDSIYVLGPRARIEDPPNMITLDPADKNQCSALPSGYYKTVDFVNTSQYFRSEHVFRLWDFGDPVAPQCTSFLVPNVGFPPLGGWSTAMDQYNNSTGYWVQNGQRFPGRRLDCNFSNDTLPLHNYTDWDIVYKWYRYGHDFMPWNPQQYTRTPADTLPTANPRKIWVQNWDTLWWNRPVYLDPNTGLWSLNQGTWTDPFTNQTVLWPRIDNIPSRNVQGQPAPQDLEPYNRFILQNGAPDPFVGFYGNTIPGQGGYGFVPRGTLIDPKFDTMTLKYTAINGDFVKHHYDSLIPNSPEPTSFYRYMFNRGVQRCITVRQFLKDSLNNVGAKSHIVANDIQKLDSLDCEHDDQVQLKLMRPDARGLGKKGVECPGPYSSPDRAGIQFMLSSVSDRLGDYPGINPDCGQSFILFNHDSMADRLDQTPCALDAFMGFGGGTTPGGLNRPPFANRQDFGQFLPPNLWADPFGTSFWYHYGPGVASGWPLDRPANPEGWVTVGLIVGSGDPANACISDTIWYHNFLYFGDLDGRFFIDPTYHPVTKAPTNGACKLYCKNDIVNFVYIDSTQLNLKHSTISWGDNSVTVDSFIYAANPKQNDGYFVNGFRRVRYQIYYGPCGEWTDGIVYDSIVFPNGIPGVNVDTVWKDNYTFRLFNATTNPFGSLVFLGRSGDSTNWQECGRSFWVKDRDTLSVFYVPDYQDQARMLLPVQHKYWSSSYENDCKRPGAAPRAVSHLLGSTQECKKQAQDSKLLVRGVIDSAMVRNSRMEFDEIFCVGEEVHFYDSVRYFRPDCSLSDPINGNPNRDWSDPTRPALDPPFDSYHYDTADYWRKGATDPNDFRPDGSYVEKMKWYFGDGDSAMWTRPVHKYKNPGKYTVTMLSRDRLGCWDTSYATVYVTEPVSEPLIKPGLYNCGDLVTFFDGSFMKPVPGVTQNVYDSIKTNFWFFGERKTDTLRFDAQAIDTPVWLYRGNGSFRIKLVVESHQGCKDTGFANLYISGPRPFIKVITDTVGCSPFTVKVVNYADVFGGRDAADTPTKSTIILWGDANNQQTVSLGRYDTLSFTYNDSGTFFIFAKSDDNNPQSDNQGCKIVYFPDTIGGIDAPIKITVKRSYPAEIRLDKQTVCVDQVFNVTNLSDTISYTEFKYIVADSATNSAVQTVVKTNLENRFPLTISDTGMYKVLLEPTTVAPGLPFCRLFDTVGIKVVRPYASFEIDSAKNSSKFGLRNTSLSSSQYTWTAARVKDPNTIIATVDKVESDRDWLYDFGTDTGDVIICLEAFTADPAKPICLDKVCDTISYRFVTQLEIYNVFTPNKDNKNDVFNIVIQGEAEYDLVIYNRWGTKVFETKSAAIDWDGTNMNDGTACPAGTYYYVFKYSLLNGESKTVNGTVTLIRDDE
ncbi:MAG: PKD domain-containing protein [Bacteroidota bacterium]